MNECKRRQYRMQHGVALPDELPNGVMVPKEWKRQLLSKVRAFCS